MELTPRDLGDDHYLVLVRRRLAPAGQNESAGATMGTRRRRVRTRLARRVWTRRLDVDEPLREKLADVMASQADEVNWFHSAALAAALIELLVIASVSVTSFVEWLDPDIIGRGSETTFALFFFTISLLAGFGGLAFGRRVTGPRRAVERAHRNALTAAEVEALLPTARGRLDRQYLLLVADTLRQEVKSPTAHAGIRAALRDLGETVSRLPSDTVPSADSASLVRDAQACRDRAAGEGDSVVRASLLREAESLARRAALGAENAVPARRAASLRREARAHINALRGVLVAMQHPSAGDAVHAAQLGEAVSRVAQEAQAVALARRELEADEIAALLGHALPENLPHQPVAAPPVTVAAKPAEAQTVTVGQGGQGGRPWWRG